LNSLVILNLRKDRHFFLISPGLNLSILAFRGSYRSLYFPQPCLSPLRRKGGVNKLLDLRQDEGIEIGLACLCSCRPRGSISDQGRSQQRDCTCCILCYPVHPWCSVALDTPFIHLSSKAAMKALTGQDVGVVHFGSWLDIIPSHCGAH